MAVRLYSRPKLSMQAQHSLAS